MKFIATAEHSMGQSLEHPCRKGVYADPTSMFQVEIEAEGLIDAEHKVFDMLDQAVQDAETCQCERRAEPGSDDWWESVSIALWPQDADAMRAWIDNGGDPSYDPYGLWPATLRDEALEIAND